MLNLSVAVIIADSGDNEEKALLTALLTITFRIYCVPVLGYASQERENTIDIITTI